MSHFWHYIYQVARPVSYTHLDVYKRQIQESFDLFKQGLTTHDIKLIGQAATLSAFGNQRILYKPNLYDFHDVGNSYNSVGTIIAHSGTIMGLLFPVDYGRINDRCV